MSCFYPSHASNSARDSTGMSGSATSAFGLFAHAKADRATQLSKVIGNKAYDNTLQINGHVADNIRSYNMSVLHMLRLDTY
jgi:hypothetical protein